MEWFGEFDREKGRGCVKSFFYFGDVYSWALFLIIILLNIIFFEILSVFFFFQKIFRIFAF